MWFVWRNWKAHLYCSCITSIINHTHTYELAYVFTHSARVSEWSSLQFMCLSAKVWLTDDLTTDFPNKEVVITVDVNRREYRCVCMQVLILDVIQSALFNPQYTTSMKEQYMYYFCLLLIFSLNLTHMPSIKYLLTRLSGWPRPALKRIVLFVRW